MIALPKARHAVDGAPRAAQAHDWLLTERQAREAAATMEPTLARRAERALPRRFTGAPMTGFGDLS